MMDLKFFSQGNNGLINKMCALITHQDLQTLESSDDVFKFNFVVVAAVQSLTSRGSCPLVNYFVAVMIYLALVHFPGRLIGPTKSIVHFSNARKLNCCCKGISSLLEGFPTLWHTSQGL